MLIGYQQAPKGQWTGKKPGIYQGWSERSYRPPLKPVSRAGCGDLDGYGYAHPGWAEAHL